MVMLSFEKERNRKVAEKVIKGLQSRNMEGYFVETKDRSPRPCFGPDSQRFKRQLGRDLFH